MPIYKYLLSILTTISALAGAFLAASSGLPAYLAGQPLKAGIFAVLCLLEGLSAYLLWRPGKRALAVLNGGLLAAALLLFWQGEGLAAGSAPGFIGNQLFAEKGRDLGLDSGSSLEPGLCRFDHAAPPVYVFPGCLVFSYRAKRADRLFPAF
ncbi:hypothetical protein LOB78_00615 [Lactobacillus delbrueckii subsp. lactis]|uniref:hypothetical protein n=1 Tax=Lactobacillus delbrueckii TaxID=1584 RepID=UPI0004A5C981|nr:hypothetical protein [Lactobacillus delbrueckii]MCD5443343.1 hypothetical protein [Lactobacillus delbrueckii subsp. lactis]MCD5507715.1 hypothetical protein [Lactobacillus delbrueckii subsp. lactis]MCD5509593.1 hypothetical protein [Lactobacillus delbrueckii subsp. lactis]MCD5511324.1 hypothetical protein [Lactobacillus delbrueckii subsp. lactis]CDR76760.1 Hypothetical membrane protein [Lactobacillus delbrueckii subsp. lactis]